MGIYAIIYNSEVIDVMNTDEDVSKMFHPDIKHQDVTNLSNKPSVGDKFVDGVYIKEKPIKLAPSKTEVEHLRLVAYCDPLSGCDRYFSESISLQAEGYAVSSAEVKEAKAKGLARKAEIQTLYPWPDA